MSNMQRAVAILILTLAGGHSALADFRMSGPAQPPATVSDVPHVDAGDREKPGFLAHRRPSHSIIPITAHSGPHRKAIQIGVVEGFGNAVPLAFAVRQIVPKIIHVTYGPGVDPATLVTWHGGRAWAAVLRDALKPAGLSLAPHGTTIEIMR